MAVMSLICLRSIFTDVFALLMTFMLAVLSLVTAGDSWPNGTCAYNLRDCVAGVCAIVNAIEEQTGFVSM